jgi:hypothetical protein
MAKLDQLHVGQSVIYVSNTGYGLRYDWAATIVAITAKRVTIRYDDWPARKPTSVSPSNIRIKKEN